jgi:uncharacterized phiE125 gp8 family phage protein
MMALKLITVGSQAVTTVEAKAHLRVTDTAEDTLITSLVLAAQAHVENVLGAPLTSETWEQSLDGFPCGAIRLLKQPVTSVTSVKYDVNGVEATLAPADYSTDLPGGRVWSRASWPTADDVASVRVRFAAGYTLVPAPLKAAVLLLVGDMYANREAKQATDLGDNPTVARLLFPYRMML